MWSTNLRLYLLAIVCLLPTAAIGSQCQDAIGALIYGHGKHPLGSEKNLYFPTLDEVYNQVNYLFRSGLRNTLIIGSTSEAEFDTDSVVINLLPTEFTDFGGENNRQLDPRLMTLKDNGFHVIADASELEKISSGSIAFIRARNFACDINTLNKIYREIARLLKVGGRLKISISGGVANDPRIEIPKELVHINPHDPKMEQRTVYHGGIPRPAVVCEFIKLKFKI